MVCVEQGRNALSKPVENGKKSANPPRTGDGVQKRRHNHGFCLENPGDPHAGVIACQRQKISGMTIGFVVAPTTWQQFRRVIGVRIEHLICQWDREIIVPDCLRSSRRRRRQLEFCTVEVVL